VLVRIANHKLQSGSGRPIRFMSSPNCGGTLRPSYLVMHYTAGRSADSAAAWLCNPLAKASAHLVIGKDGKVIQCVPFNVVAWHAGQSSWKDESGKTLVGMNKHSIGIELDNAGRVVRQGGKWRSLSLGTTYSDSQVVEATHKHENKPSGWVAYPTAQLDCLREVAALLINNYGLKDIVGHDDIAPGRKSDPGPAFPMASFRSQLLGRTSDDAPAANIRVTTASVNVRSGPGTNFSPVVPIPLPEGTRVEVLASEGVWKQVDVLDAIDGVQDVHGWVHGRYLG
jgi:N-acetylmuramoyl-L-alanine amidase